MKKTLIVLVVGVVSLLGKCSQNPQHVNQEPDDVTVSESYDRPIESLVDRNLSIDLGQHTQQFASQLFSRIIETDPTRNCMISPLSITYALGMTANGSGGPTTDTILTGLGYSDHTLLEVNSYLSNLAYSLSLNNQGMLRIANAIWARDDYMPLKRSFYELVTEYYLADIHTLTTVDKVNAWVRIKTNGKIPVILQDLPSTTALVLINAVYFKGIWLDQFDSDNTRKQIFSSPSGQTSVPFMNSTNEYKYKKTQTYEAIRIPYKNEETALYVFLPDTTSSLSDFYTHSLIDGSDKGYFYFDYVPNEWKWQDDPGEELFSHFDNAEVTLSLPAYTFEFESSLKNHLSAMGMKDIFGSASSDFSNFAVDKDPWVFDVIHKTFIEVNEEGTEAAAATAVIMVDSAAMSVPVTLNIDRPFFFCIRDDTTGAILFMGQLTNP